MLSAQELADIDGAVATAYNLEVTISQKGSGDSWNPVLVAVPCMIIPATSVERATGVDTYGRPVDGTMRCAANPLITIGFKVSVTKINGLAPLPWQSNDYEILARDSLLSLGHQLELKLWRMV